MKTAAAHPGPRPPAILVGANVVTAVSVIRSLARAGVDVRLLCRAGAVPSYSRYARRIPIDASLPQQEAWLGYLLGPESEELRGAVLMACNDDGLELLLEHRDELAGKYRLDVCDPGAQRAMLDKLATYRLAAAAGVPTPRFWSAESEHEVRAHADEYVYPLMIKPLHSHEFKRVHEGKYLMAADFEELLAAWRRTHEHGVDVVLLEMIPGPDDLLCSYYTYLDERGAPQFHFTKRVIRRYPEHEGFGCYHITDWNPEVRDLGLRLFAHVGLRGVANVEFKRDPRDGRLKVIEVNARFTAANGLVAAAGYDLAQFVYNRACRTAAVIMERQAVPGGPASLVPAGRLSRLPRPAEPGEPEVRRVAAQRGAPLRAAVLLAGGPEALGRALQAQVEDAGSGQRTPHRRTLDCRWTVRPPSCTRARWAARWARRSWPAAGGWSPASRAAAHGRRRRRRTPGSRPVATLEAAVAAADVVVSLVPQAAVVETAAGRSRAPLPERAGSRLFSGRQLGVAGDDGSGAAARRGRRPRLRRRRLRGQRTGARPEDDPLSER